MREKHHTMQAKPIEGEAIFKHIDMPRYVHVCTVYIYYIYQWSCEGYDCSVILDSNIESIDIWNKRFLKFS